MRVQQQYGDQVRFVGIPSLAGVAAMEEFVADTRIDVFPQIPDPDRILWDRFGVTEQRTYVFINDDGSVRVSGYGQLEADVEALISS